MYCARFFGCNGADYTFKHITNGRDSIISDFYYPTWSQPVLGHLNWCVENFGLLVNSFVDPIVHTCMCAHLDYLPGTVLGLLGLLGLLATTCDYLDYLRLLGLLCTFPLSSVASRTPALANCISMTPQWQQLLFPYAIEQRRKSNTRFGQLHFDDPTVGHVRC